MLVRSSIIPQKILRRTHYLLDPDKRTGAGVRSRRSSTMAGLTRSRGQDFPQRGQGCATVDEFGAKTILSGLGRIHAARLRSRQIFRIDHGDQIMISPEPVARAKSRLRFTVAAILVLALGVPAIVNAQGMVQGVQKGAREGNKAAGPIGGVLGGAIGGVVGAVGGVVGAVTGGNSNQKGAPAQPAAKQDAAKDTAKSDGSKSDASKSDGSKSKSARAAKGQK